MPLHVDLNCDLGESFGAYTIGQDHLVMQWISSANIACGFHAGDPGVMYRTVKQAAANQVAIGAHPGFPDLQGFGRRNMQMTKEEVFQLMIYQIGALQGFASVTGKRIEHVKPHGALYTMASVEKTLAEAIAEAVYRLDKRMILFALANSELAKAGRKKGLRVAEEVFADRTYQPDGTLTPRSADNAVIHDAEKAIARVIRMIKEKKVKAVDDTDIRIQADTICVHGDNPETLQFVQSLSETLKDEGIIVQPAGDK